MSVNKETSVCCLFPVSVSKRKLALLICLALASSLCLLMSLGGWVFAPAIEWKAYASSPLGLLSLISLSLLTFVCAMRANRRSLVFAAVFALLYSSALVLASNIINRSSALLGEPKTYFAIVACIPFLTLVVAGGIRLLSGDFRANRRVDLSGVGFGESKNNSIAKKLFSVLFERKYSFFLLWAIIFCCWVPILLATWPGTWAFDTIYQTQWLLNGGSITAHHPVVHTLWLSGCLWLSDVLVGNYSAGFAVYTILQMLILSFLLAGVLHITSKWGGGRWISLCSLVFFAVFPGFSVWSVVATKDVAFFGIFALCVALLVDLLLAFRRDAITKGHWIRLWFALLFMFLFRNNGIYGYALFFIVVLLVLKQYRRQFIFLSLSVMLMYGVLTGPLSQLFGIEPGSKREMMSVPASQLARTMHCSKSLSEADAAFVEKYVPNWESYDPYLADAVKGSFQIDEVMKDPLQFLVGYSRIGAEYPGIYATAALSLSVGFWAPFNDYEVGNPQRNMSPMIIGNRQPTENRPADDYIYINTESKLPPLYQALQTSSRSTSELGIPGFASIFQTGTWIWFVVLYCFICLYKKSGRMILPAVLLLAYWLTLMLGPVSIFRYSVVAIACVPIFIAALSVIRGKFAN